jgi:hypothetical protein
MNFAVPRQQREHFHFSRVTWSKIMWSLTLVVVGRVGQGMGCSWQGCGCICEGVITRRGPACALWWVEMGWGAYLVWASLSAPVSPHLCPLSPPLLPLLLLNLACDPSCLWHSYVPFRVTYEKKIREGLFVLCDIYFAYLIWAVPGNFAVKLAPAQGWHTFLEW